MKPFCCFVGCDAPAHWQVQGRPAASPYEDNTQACDNHLGHLMDDRAYRITPIGFIEPQEQIHSPEMVIAVEAIQQAALWINGDSFDSTGSDGEGNFSYSEEDIDRAHAKGEAMKSGLIQALATIQRTLRP